MVNVSESWRTKLSANSGVRASSDIIKNVIDGGINYSRDQITELDLTVLDKGLVLFRSGVFRTGSVITYGGLKFVVTGYGIKQESAGAVITINTTSKLVSNLQKQKGAKSWGTISVASFVKSVAKSAGAKGYYCHGVPARYKIARQKSSDGSQNESTWDVLQRLADEFGAWCWEADGVLYLTRPQYMSMHPKVQYSIVWNSETSYSGALKQMPEYSYSMTSDPREQLSLVVQSSDGDNIRPGHIFKLTGAMGQARGKWIVTDLDIPFQQNAEITVNLKRPINPPPQQAAV